MLFTWILHRNNLKFQVKKHSVQEIHAYLQRSIELARIILMNIEQEAIYFWSIAFKYYGSTIVIFHFLLHLINKSNLSHATPVLKP